MADLSVCIPAYRAEQWLPATLAAVGASSLDFELVIHHDMEGRGAGWARNRCLERATGEWILKLDADDLVTPGLIEKLYEARGLDRIVCPATAQFFDASETLHSWSYEGMTSAEMLTQVGSPASSAGCLLYHRELGGFPEDCGGYESWAFVCRHIARGIAVVPVEGTSYLHRLHADSYWGRSAPTRREDLHRAMLLVNEVYAEAYR